MIIEYLRPDTMEAAIEMLQRSKPATLALGGGSVLSKHKGKSIAVVDLQNLGLNQITHSAEIIEIGATATLSEIESTLADPEMTKAIRIQAGKNQRNSGTIAGLINVADGRSSLLTMLLALDAQLTWLPGEKTISLADWLTQRTTWREAVLISKIMIPQVVMRFETVARTPKDLPIVAIAIAKWPSGRLRIAVGGFGALPVLAMDGSMQEEVVMAVDKAFSHADDNWASANYRREAGKILAARLLAEIRHSSEEKTK